MYENVILSSGGFKTEGYLEELLETMDKTDANTIFYGSSMGAFWAVGASFGKDILMKMIIQGKLYVEEVRESWLAKLGTCKNRMREIMEDFPEHGPAPAKLVKRVSLAYRLRKRIKKGI